MRNTVLISNLKDEAGCNNSEGLLARGENGHEERNLFYPQKIFPGSRLKLQAALSLSLSDLLCG